jgi:hypothetical protein
MGRCGDIPYVRNEATVDRVASELHDYINRVPEVVDDVVAGET